MAGKRYLKTASGDMCIAQTSMFPATMNIEKNVMQAYVIQTDTRFTTII